MCVYGVYGKKSIFKITILANTEATLLLMLLKDCSRINLNNDAM